MSDFLRGRCREFPGCHKVLYKSPTRYLWEQQSYPGTTWRGYLLKKMASKRLCPSPHHVAKEFAANVHYQGEAVQTNWIPCLCLHRPKTFNSSWISLTTSRLIHQTDSWLYHCRLCMLAGKLRNWNHQHWSHAIFDDEFRVRLYHSDRRAREFDLFLGCNNPLSFQ